MDEVRELAEWTAQLVVVHDHRIRELGTLLHTMEIPIGTGTAKALGKVDTDWKEKHRAYLDRKRRTENTESTGSKHLMLAAVLLTQTHAGEHTRAEIKRILRERWTGKDTTTPEFLDAYVKIMKWRQTKDGKRGILEFKLVEDLREVEMEIIRVLRLEGAVLKTGPAPRGPLTWEVEDMMKGKWKTNAAEDREK